MSNAFVAATEDVLTAARNDQPDGMLQVTANYHMLPHGIENFAAAMKVQKDRADEYPLHPAIKELAGTVHRAVVAAQEAAAEIGPLIERIHRDELDRLRNPRPNEQMFDVSSNRDAV